MSQQARKDTGPEVAVRRLLHRAGLRYRLDFPVPGSPRRTIDIAFPGPRVGVFVDGCFWHGCPRHKGVPIANREWWIAKIAANRARDAETSELLRQAGWSVLRVWEHESPGLALGEVEKLVRRSPQAVGTAG